jgi:hypothetical protein
MRGAERFVLIISLLGLMAGVRLGDAPDHSHVMQYILEVLPHAQIAMVWIAQPCSLTIRKSAVMGPWIIHKDILHALLLRILSFTNRFFLPHFSTCPPWLHIIRPLYIRASSSIHGPNGYGSSSSMCHYPSRSDRSICAGEWQYE